MKGSSKKTIENIVQHVIRKIIEEEMSDKLPKIEYEEIIRIFVDYLEKIDENRRSELYRAFDILPETRLLGIILSVYNSVKGNSKKKKVDADIVAKRVESWYYICDPNNFKEELERDIQPATEYLILLLQTGRKEIEEHWSDLKMIGDVFGIEISPLISPYYSKQRTFFDTALSYKSKKKYGVISG